MLAKSSLPVPVKLKNNPTNDVSDESRNARTDRINKVHVQRLNNATVLSSLILARSADFRSLKRTFLLVLRELSAIWTLRSRNCSQVPDGRHSDMKVLQRRLLERYLVVVSKIPADRPIKILLAGVNQ